MKDREWWVNLLGQMDAYPGNTQEDVTERLAELGYDAHAMYDMAYAHASREAFITGAQAESNAAWMCFGIELGIRAERALRLEQEVG